MADDKLLNLVAAECPKCGAAAQLDSGQERAFCKYCGTQILVAQKKEIHQHFGESVGTVEAHLKMARTALTGGNFESAIEYIDNILKIQPDNADAWLMKGTACGKFTVMKTEIRTTQVRDKKGNYHSETYTVEVPTYPRAGEGSSAFRHGVELYEQRMDSGKDVNSTIDRICEAYRGTEGESGVVRYLANFVQTKPGYAYPYELLVNSTLANAQYAETARWVTTAEKRSPEAAASQVLADARARLQQHDADLLAQVDTAKAATNDLKTPTWISIGVAVLGVVLLFTPALVLGIVALIVAAVVYNGKVSQKKKDLKIREAALSTFRQSWPRG